MSKLVAEEPLALPPGHSTEQREAEAEILDLLGRRLGAALTPRRIVLANGSHVEIDGASEAPPLLCEAWAHQGRPKAAQRHKVLADAFKLEFLGQLQSPRPRLILCFADPEAAQPFQGRTWPAQALRELKIDIEVVDIPSELREGICHAQQRQRR